MNLNVNDRVVCTAHSGSHAGVVAAVLAPGVGYGVAWDDRNPDFGVEGAPRADEPQHTPEFLSGHRGDLVWCAADRVRPAAASDVPAGSSSAPGADPTNFQQLVTYVHSLDSGESETSRQARVFATLLNSVGLTAHQVSCLLAWASALGDTQLTALVYNAAADEDLA